MMRRLFLCLGVVACTHCSDDFSYRDYKNVNLFQDLAVAHHVDFDVSMRANQDHQFAGNARAMNVLNQFRMLYKKNNLQCVAPSQTCKIPKIVHYIWFGIKLPEKYRPLLQSWFDAHPDWTFLLWVDNPENYDLGTFVHVADFDEIQNILDDPEAKAGRFVVDVKNLEFPNRNFFDGTRNYGERSDIFRWSAVYRLGGVYIDVDCECFKPLDLLHHTYDFYTGIQPLDTAAVQLGAALFGAIPGHPILHRCVETLKDNMEHKQIVVRTGPIHFTRCFLGAAGKNGLHDVAFPASYFYPCWYEQAGLPRETWIRAESFATHHWAGSWMKKEGWEQS